MYSSRRIPQLAIFLALCAFAAAARAGTPTLKRSWGYTGLASGVPDKGNNFTFSLEASGTPAATASGDLIVLAVRYPNANTLTPSCNANCGTWTSALSCTDTAHTPNMHFQVMYSSVTGVVTQITLGFGSAITNLQVMYHVFYNTATSSITDGAGKCTTAITPVNNTAPNVSSGSYTTSDSGDLIYNVAFDEGTSSGLNVGSGNPISAIAFGSGFTGLQGENGYGSAAQYEIQSSAGAINPGMTFTQTTHDRFVSMTVAFNAGSGGSAPTSGIRIVHSQFMYAVNPGGTSIPYTFPSSGNAIVIQDDAPNVNTDAVPTDSASNTFSLVTWEGSGYPLIRRACSATTSSSLTGSLAFHAGSTNTMLVGIYDVAGANTSCLDTAATAANSSTLTGTASGSTYNDAQESSTTISDAASITPSTASGLVFDVGNIGTGPATASSQTFDYVGATWSGNGTSSGDQNGLCNGDFMAHYFNATASTVDFSFTVVNQSAFWQGVATSFKAAPVSSGCTPSLTLLGVGRCD